MNVYDALHQNWVELENGLSQSQRDKLNALLSVDDEVQIRSNLELLLGFGDCGLCHVFEVTEDQLVLVEGLCNELLWIKAILEYVTANDSGWFYVYESGHFNRLEMFVFGM